LALGLLESFYAQAVSVLNIDFIYAGYSEKFEGSTSASSGSSLKTNTTMFFGSGAFRYGPLLQYEIPSENSAEYIAGGAIGMGANYFLELGGGYLKRDFGSYEESGYGFMAKVGKHFSLGSGYTARISVPFIYKQITSGLANKTIYNYIPYIGLGVGF